MNIMALSHDLTRLICDQFNFVIRYKKKISTKMKTRKCVKMTEKKYVLLGLWYTLSIRQKTAGFGKS